MSDLRAFIAIDHNDEIHTYGPWDFAKSTNEVGVSEEESYYDTLDMCEGGSGMSVIEIIKRPNGKWEHIGPHA